MNGYDFLCITFCQLCVKRLDRHKRLTGWIDDRLWQRPNIGRSVLAIKRRIPFPCDIGEFETALRANGYRIVKGKTDADVIRCLD